MGGKLQREFHAVFLWHPEARGGEGLQSLQRPTLACMWTPLWPGRDQSAADGPRLFHHARKSEPGDPGGHEHVLLRHDWERYHYLLWRRGGTVGTQRDGAGDNLQALHLGPRVDQRHEHLARAVYIWHHGEPRALPRDGAQQHWYRHCSAAPHRVQEVHRGSS